MNCEMHDVVVVGAGPCGSTAAYEIAKAGYDVLLLERDKVPGQFNSCGGGLGNFLLKKFDLPDSLVHKRINKVQLDITTKKKLYQADQPIYVSVKRTELDPFLARRAESVGAQLRCYQKAVDYDPFHKHVKVLDRATETHYQVGGKIVIFADGARSMAWQVCRIGVDHKRESIIGVAFELDYPDNPHEAFEFLFNGEKLPYGYYWVFPTTDTLNVGMGGPTAQLGGRIGKLLQEFIDSRDDLRGRKVVRKTSGLIPSYVADQLHGDGVLVVGDAGGFVNPLTGGGIYLGMVSAQMAARTACEALAAQTFDASFLQRYTHRIKLSPIYAGLKTFHALVAYCEWRRRRTGKAILGRVFELYSDVGDFALRRL